MGRWTNMLVLVGGPLLLIMLVFFVAGRGGAPVRKLIGSSNTENHVYQPTWGLVEGRDLVFHVANLPRLTNSDLLTEWQPASAVVKNAPLRWEIGPNPVPLGLVEPASLSYH